MISGCETEDIREIKYIDQCEIDIHTTSTFLKCYSPPLSSCFHINASVPPDDGRQAAQRGAGSRHRCVVGAVQSCGQNAQRPVLSRWRRLWYRDAPLFPSAIFWRAVLCCRSHACCSSPASGLDSEFCWRSSGLHDSAGDFGQSLPSKRGVDFNAPSPPQRLSIVWYKCYTTWKWPNKALRSIFEIKSHVLIPHSHV